jgi:hypothetical protein
MAARRKSHARRALTVLYAFAFRVDPTCSPHGIATSLGSAVLRLTVHSDVFRFALRVFADRAPGRRVWQQGYVEASECTRMQISWNCSARGRIDSTTAIGRGRGGRYADLLILKGTARPEQD